MAAISSTSLLPLSTNSLDICFEIFGKRQGFPDNITNLITTYIPPEEQAFILNRSLPYFDISNPLSSLIDLSNRRILATYLGKNGNNNAILSAATEIAQRTYEASKRPIAGTSKYGQAFPMTPEVVAYAMQLAKNQTVLEIAGASGENAILFACAEAQQVYLNDIEPKEIETFQTLKNQLPTEIKRKLRALEGDCLDLLTMEPDLFNRVGLILCQNLIHFFNHEQQKRFFSLVKKMLKPCGRAIFTANSVYLSEKSHILSTNNPECTSFKITRCLLTDYLISSAPIAIMLEEYSIVADTDVSAKYESLYLYERNSKTNFKWQVNKDEFQKISSSLTRQKIKDAIEKDKEAIKKIQSGSVRVLINTVRLYSTTSLSNLFKNYGFTVEANFLVNDTGHIIEDGKSMINVMTTGAIVRNL